MRIGGLFNDESGDCSGVERVYAFRLPTVTITPRKTKAGKGDRLL